MAEFTLRVQDPVRERVAQIRESGSWEDIRLPLAELVEQLRAQVENVEGQISINNLSIIGLAADIPNSARAEIAESLSNRVDFSNQAIDILSRRTTVLEGTIVNKAETTSVDTLMNSLTEAEGIIEANQQAITLLQTSVAGKAETTALDTLADRVTATESTITAEQARLTALTIEVGTKASATALTSLSNRVMTAENTITAEQARLTALTIEVGTKASLTALSALTNRVTTNEGEIDAVQTAITTLTTVVAGKAETSALNVLANRVSVTEGQIDTNVESITQLNTEIATKASLMALSALSSRVTTTQNTVTAEQVKLTALTTVVAGKADSSALTALANRVSSNDNDITIITSEITALEARIVGTALGPETNSFTGTNRAAAETARDRYFTNNPSKLAEYDADGSINIRLTWGVLRVYQFRENDAWVDNGEVEPTATAVTSLNATVNMHTREIGENATAITANSADITVLRSTVDGIDTAAISTLETKVERIENVDGTTTLAGLARWLVKTQVNDLVGGVGLYNDGTTVDFIINANRFAVVPPGWTGAAGEKRIPFAVVTDHRYVMTWNAFSGASSYQYRTSATTNSWGPWQNAPSNRRVQLTTSQALRFQIRTNGGRLSNIVTYISGDSDTSAPVFPAPSITVSRTSTAQTYIDVAVIRDASILGAKIGNAVITSAHIANATILGADIATAQIGSAHIVDAAILSAKIGLAQINNAHILDATIDFAKIAKGNIFDLTIGNKIQSANYQRSGSRTLPAEAATVVLEGITFTADTGGVAENGNTVTFRANRVASVTGTGIVVSGDADDLIVEFRDDGTQDTVRFDRSDVVDAVNAYGSSGVTASGSGSFDVDFAGLTESSITTVSQTFDVPRGDYQRIVSTTKGWYNIYDRLDPDFETAPRRLDEVLLLATGVFWIDLNTLTAGANVEGFSADFLERGLMTLISEDGEVLEIQCSNLSVDSGTYQTTAHATDVIRFSDTLSNTADSEALTLFFDLPTESGNPRKDLVTGTLSGGEDSRVVTGGQGWQICKDGNVQFNEGVFTGNVRIGVDISSQNFSAGSDGWIIRQDGSAEFDAASIRGVLTAEQVNAPNLRSWRNLYDGVSQRYGRVSIPTGDNTEFTALSFTIQIYGRRGGPPEILPSLVIPRENGAVNVLFMTDNHSAIITVADTIIQFVHNAGTSTGAVREIWGIK